MKYLNGFFFLSFVFVLNSVRSFHWRIYAGTAPVFRLFSCQYTCQCICLSVCLPACLFVCVSVCLSVCQPGSFSLSEFSLSCLIKFQGFEKISIKLYNLGKRKSENLG